MTSCRKQTRKGALTGGGYLHQDIRVQLGAGWRWDELRKIVSGEDIYFFSSYDKGLVDFEKYDCEKRDECPPDHLKLPTRATSHEGTRSLRVQHVMTIEGGDPP